MTLSYIMVTKHRECHLQMSETLSMPMALFELNIEILLADATEPEKSNILTLTWPVTSLVTPKSLQFFSFKSFPELWNAVWIFRIGPVVSEIRGGRGLEIVPPQCYKNTGLTIEPYDMGDHFLLRTTEILMKSDFSSYLIPFLTIIGRGRAQHNIWGLKAPKC